ncbi:hypothetical protein P8452_56801 [Trifolium repens]|nr:hypothetical protein P8452_56801 [Trifolium repens]
MDEISICSCDFSDSHISYARITLLNISFEGIICNNCQNVGATSGDFIQLTCMCKDELDIGHINCAEFPNLTTFCCVRDEEDGGVAETFGICWNGVCS